MSITVQDVEKIAQLAKLSFTDEEKQIFAEQFNQILGYMEKLNELDTEHVPPTAHVLGLVNVMRNDEVKPWPSPQDILVNAPKTNNGYFSVPKVIDIDS
jgi:aspartyl-tRNA(Asn)/glutamyl-tRNA(Gln) amidotransferase subunit C